MYDTAGDSNRLLKATYPDGRTVSYSYDDNGNIVRKDDSKIVLTTPYNQTTTYKYNADNLLESVTVFLLPIGS